MNEILHFTSENIFLIGSILVFTAILVSKTGNKYGVPSLLIFLLVGMLFGSDGLGLVFDNYNIAQFLSIIALCVILFTGGLETKLKDIRPVMGPGLVLSTVGVLLTVVFTGAFIYFLSRIEQIGLSLSIVMCFLLAAVMSSTDSASVFSILKNCNMRLKQNLRPMLELESGSNDPMAYVLTIVLIQVAQLLFDPVSSIEGINYTQLVVGSLVTLVLQMSLGALTGVAIGFATVWILQRIKLNSTPLYSILLLAVSMFAFSMTQMIQGNGYLAVYIAGFIIGNKPMNNRKEILSFMDGMTWIMQIGMFLSLGLLVNPHEMLHVAPIALLIGLFLLSSTSAHGFHLPAAVPQDFIPCQAVHLLGGPEGCRADYLRDISYCGRNPGLGTDIQHRVLHNLAFADFPGNVDSARRQAAASEPAGRKGARHIRNRDTGRGRKVTGLHIDG